LKKDKDGRWQVPKLSNIVFDLSELHSLSKDEGITIDPVYDHSGFVLELFPGVRVVRFVDQGQILKFSVTTPKPTPDTNSDIGVILVADANDGIVKLSGNIKSKWSMNVSWSSK